MARDSTALSCRRAPRRTWLSRKASLEHGHDRGRHFQYGGNHGSHVMLMVIMEGGITEGITMVENIMVVMAEEHFGKCFTAEINILHFSLRDTTAAIVMDTVEKDIAMIVNIMGGMVVILMGGASWRPAHGGRHHGAYGHGQGRIVSHIREITMC